MKSNLGHAQINVNPANLGFYKDLMSFLGWKLLYEDPTMIGMGDEHNTSLWFCSPIKEAASNDYDGKGMNHVGISVASQADVDQTVAYLQQHGVASLFETPRHRPEFCASPDQTYYQVMFESPDRILYEVVYTGPKA